MSKINDLIQKMCPNGVEYKELYRILKWNKRFASVDKKKQNEIFNTKTNISAQFLKSLATEDGNIKLLSTGNFDGYTNEESYNGDIDDCEVITIPSGGTANLKYYKGKFINSGNILATSIDCDKYYLKYIYHCMLDKKNIIQNFFRGSSVQHPDMKSIIEIKIPCPPIEIQKEVVRILDRFGELEAELEVELEAELEARESQYEFWSRKIFENYDNKNTKHITDIAIVKARVGWQRLTTAEYLSEGDYYLITGTDFNNDGSINFDTCVYVTKERYDMDENIKIHKDDILITKDGTLGKVAYLENEPNKLTTLNSGVFRIKIIDDEVMPRYIYHYFNSKIFKDFIESVKTGSTIPHLTQEKLVTLNIPIPNVNEQKKIINILDKFDNLTRSLIIGLQAEIELRRKQYKYYRNKLLSFEELSASE